MYLTSVIFYFIIKNLYEKTLLSVFASVLLLGVFAFADQDSTWSNHAWTGNAAFTGTSTAAIACVKTALDNREAGVKWAMDTYYATWGTAFTARGIAFTDALFLPTRQGDKESYKCCTEDIQDCYDHCQKSEERNYSSCMECLQGRSKTLQRRCGEST